jgi:threonine dehydrogenase-like Zn-dependent dehydrogenase
MRATFMYGLGDLHPYHQMEASGQGVPMGHEFVGVVEAAGSEVSSVKAGDFAVRVVGQLL